VPVGFSFSNSNKVIDRATRPSENLKDDELSLSLSNDSDLAGETNFEVTQDKYSRSETGTPIRRGLPAISI